MSNQFLTVPLSNPDTKAHARQCAITINNVMDGKLNSTGEITLTASSTTTTLSDARIGLNSVLLFMPQTANARTALNGDGLKMSPSQGVDVRILEVGAVTKLVYADFQWNINMRTPAHKRRYAGTNQRIERPRSVKECGGGYRNRTGVRGFANKILTLNHCFD